MASELYVETLKGLTSGDNANKVIIPSGQTLDASAGTLTPSSGQVIQVVEASITTDSATNSSSYVDTGLTVSITPKSSSSSILVMPFLNDLGINGSARVKVKLQRRIDGSDYGDLEEWSGAQGYADNTTSSVTPVYKDSPATTGVVDYKILFALESGSATVRINNMVSNSGSGRSNFVLMEIAG